MAEAAVGDDVFAEDPTVNRLQERVAEMLGKEAGLFVVSGTMGNLLSIWAQTQPGEEIIVERGNHVYNYEASGLAHICGLLVRVADGERGRLSPEQVRALLHDGSNIHTRRTGMLELENTHNNAGGTVLTVEQTRALADVAHEAGARVHLDGSRIFNAAVALGVDVRELVAPVDSVQFCFSKGLGAPVGSMICSTREVIERCRQLRKMYNDAGVNIHIHKNRFGRSDEEIEFNFLMAKALGCTGISLERNEAMARRLAPFAEKHKIWIAFHNHTRNVPVMDKRDPILDYGEYIGYNFDVGHYVAGTRGKSPIPVIERYHDRIVSLHLKDRTADGKNLPWGQGQTPLKEILRLMRDNKWTFPADIELEYRIPPGSDAIKEVRRCLEFCREALA